MSTKAQHTPGPWRIENGSILSGANGLRVAEYREAPGLGHAAEANARLIAKAPKLLAMLENIEWEAHRAEMNGERVPNTLVTAIDNAIAEAKE